MGWDYVHVCRPALKNFTRPREVMFGTCTRSKDAQQVGYTRLIKSRLFFVISDQLPYTKIWRETAVYVLRYLYCSFPIPQGGCDTVFREQFGGVIRFDRGFLLQGGGVLSKYTLCYVLGKWKCKTGYSQVAITFLCFCLRKSSFVRELHGIELDKCIFNLYVLTFLVFALIFVFGSKVVSGVQDLEKQRCQLSQLRDVHRESCREHCYLQWKFCSVFTFSVISSQRSF